MASFARAALQKLESLPRVGGRIVTMYPPVQLPPFLRGSVEGVHPVVGVWLRDLEEVGEIVEKWAGDLGPEGFWWVPAPETNPIGGIINHFGRSSLRLLYRGTGQEVPEGVKGRPGEEMKPTGRDPKEVLAEFRERMRLVREGLSKLSKVDLHTPRPFLDVATVPAIFILNHIVGHAQQHAGQIITTRKLWNAQAGS